MEALSKKVEKLRKRLEKQTKDYYGELAFYRFQHRNKQNQALQALGGKDYLKTSFEVRLFDETEVISKEHRSLMNERLFEMQTRYNIQALAQQEAQAKIIKKLNYYEKLKPQQYVLLDMSADQIFQGLSAIEDNPQKVWDLIHQHYKPNFFEQVIMKRYASLFENRDEEEFKRHISSIKDKVAEEILSLQKQYEGLVKQLKGELGEKNFEIIALKERFNSFQIECQRYEHENAVKLIEEREKLGTPNFS